MFTVGLLMGLVACFYVLGKAADVVVIHIKRIGIALGIGILPLGLLLGLFTSLPELALGLSAVADNIPTLSLGNLIGGLFVLLGLILGVSVAANRQVSTKGGTGLLPFTLVYLLLPVLLGLDGEIGVVDGAVLALMYFLLVYSLYAWNRTPPTAAPAASARHHHTPIDVFLTVLGIVVVLLASSLAVHITRELLSVWPVPPFLLGLLLFSIGTNLPEIMVAIRAWKRHTAELSVSHLLGSAIVNPLLIGIFAFMRPMSIQISAGYYVLLGTLVLLLSLFYSFYTSGKKLTRNEGFALVGCYAIYLVTQLVFFTAVAR